MAAKILRACEGVYNFVGPRFECAYCGEPSDTIDHCTPSWFVQGNFRLIQRYTFSKVSSCFDCNVRAGMKVDNTFIDRRRRIAVSIRRKNQRILGIADWEPDEVTRLGRSLQAYVKRGHEMATALRRRLMMLDNLALPLGVPNVLLQPVSGHADDWEEDGKIVRPLQFRKRIGLVVSKKPPMVKAIAKPWPPLRLYRDQMRLPF